MKSFPARDVSTRRLMAGARSSVGFMASWLSRRSARTLPMPHVEEVSEAPGGLQRTADISGNGPLRPKSGVEMRLFRRKLYEERHGITLANKYRRQTSSLARLLASRERSKRLVLHPQRTSWFGYWDVVTTLALLYTAIITPFEAGFMGTVYGPAAWTDIWFLINRVLDLVFLFDLVLQFFVAYETRDDRGGFFFVEDHSLIIRHYLRGWFAVDSFTIFVPFGFDIYQTVLPDPATAATEEGAGDDGGGAVVVLRVLRAVRLVKLVRLVRASRVFERWKSKISMSHATKTVFRAISMTLIGAHWYACVMALEASLHDSPEPTWLGSERYGYCKDPVMPSASVTPSTSAGLSIAGCGDVNPGSLYLGAFSWSLMVITGTGGTDFYPSSISQGETIIVMTLVLVGALIWTQVLAMFCDVATNADPGVIEFRQRLDSMNSYIHRNNLPAGMARRMREYLHQTQEVNLREFHAASVLPLLSDALQIEVVMHVYAHPPFAPPYTAAAASLGPTVCLC